MKRYLLFCQLALLCSANATAQFISGTDDFHISENTDLFIDGLTFRPTAAFSITSNTLTISPTALPGSPSSITRVYTFASPVNFVGRLGLFYLTSELNGNTETLLQVAYQNTGPATTTGSVVNTSLHYIYNDLTAPITFRAVTAAQPGALPVTLLAFTAKREELAASLNWSTSYESNSDYFNVEHSTNAKDWNIISTITAANQSSDLKSYGFIHNSPSPGSNYYRLKMVDKDQSYAYSTIRELYFEQPNQVTLYPNPTVEKVRINTDHWQNVAAIKLLNAQGTTLVEFYKKPLLREINMKNFPAGLYVVKLQLNDGSVEAVKVIKQ